jgi:hypothetical protein
MIRPSLVTADLSSEDADGGESSGDRQRGAEAGQERVLQGHDLWRRDRPTRRRAAEALADHASRDHQARGLPPARSPVRRSKRAGNTNNDPLART